MKIIKYLLLMILAGCSAHNIVERSDNLHYKPEWAQLQTANYERDGKIYFISFVEVDGASSKSAALNMSDEKAFSEPMRAVVEVFLDQNQVGEELRKDDMFGRRIISATSGYRPAMPSLKITKRYWETVTIGNRTELRAFSMAEISVADFERAKEAYLAKLRGIPVVQKILEEVGEDQREKVLEKQ